MEESEEKRQSLRESAAQLLTPPAVGGTGVPRAVLTGTGELYLEGYRGILAYSREELHLDGGKWILRVTGRALEIRAMREGEVRLAGQIDRLELV